MLQQHFKISNVPVPDPYCNNLTLLNNRKHVILAIWCFYRSGRLLKKQVLDFI